MRVLALLVAALTAVVLPSQTSPVVDVGLTMGGGNATGSAGAITGQACGPVSCVPFVAPAMSGGQTRAVRHHAPPITPFALAIGLPGVCLPFPGFANNLLLGPPLETLTLGVLGPLSLSGACQQGMAVFQLSLPVGVPGGITFRLQSVGVSVSGQLAFSSAIEITSQ